MKKSPPLVGIDASSKPKGLIIDTMRTIYLIETEKLEIHPFNEKIFRDHEDEAFDRDIQSHGIRSPIIINNKNEILDGRRRYLRAKRFGITEIPCIIEAYNDEELAVLMLNKYRQKSPRELFLEGEALEKKYKQMFPVGRPPKDREKGCQRLTRFPSVRDKVAHELDLSSGKLHQLKIVYQNEDKIPRIVKALDKGTISVNAAFQYAKLVLEKGLSEYKVLKRAINLSGLVPVRKPKQSSRKNKEYLVYCPLCNELILADRKVNLLTLEQGRKRYVRKGVIFGNSGNENKQGTA